MSECEAYSLCVSMTVNMHACVTIIASDIQKKGYSNHECVLQCFVSFLYDSTILTTRASLNGHYVLLQQACGASWLHVLPSPVSLLWVSI